MKRLKISSKNQKDLVSSLLLIVLSIMAGRIFCLHFDLGQIDSFRVGVGDIPVLLSSLWLGPFWGSFTGALSDHWLLFLF